MIVKDMKMEVDISNGDKIIEIYLEISARHYFPLLLVVSTNDKAAVVSRTSFCNTTATSTYNNYNLTDTAARLAGLLLYKNYY